MPLVPQPRCPRGLGRQWARGAQPLLHDLPQRAHARVAAEAAGEGDRNAGVRDLSPAAGGQDRTRGRAHAGARGQDVLQLVPQPARLDHQRQEPEDRQLRLRALHDLPHRDARTDALRHAPVRENCTTCHDPHGSSNDRMLVVRMPMLCQRCHIASRHPATLYDKDQITTNKSNRMFGRSCVNCHSAVHGSNHPSGQFYMR